MEDELERRGRKAERRRGKRKNREPGLDEGFM
jgi:hypothetical protein